mmetsp:Transcript_73560/g.137451  ORF Transcript_73560/g.137451 Transcript_73560/m.137451 type:complete len:379 (+) Transcript_73560:45-1181(+)
MEPTPQWSGLPLSLVGGIRVPISKRPPLQRREVLRDGTTGCAPETQRATRICCATLAIGTAAAKKRQVPRRAARQGLEPSMFSPPSREGVPEAKLEVLGGAATSGKTKPVTILFIHGSYHAAWCWEPYFLPYFRERGFNSYALSLRGQGQGSVAVEEALPVAGTLETHAADVAAYAAALHGQHGQPVVVVGHSFGGLIVQRAVFDLCSSQPSVIGGMALLSSVPPTGLSGGVWRVLMSDPGLAFNITWGFVTRAFERDNRLCRQLFFDDDMENTQVGQYASQMKGSSPPGTRLLDLRELQNSLPVPAARKVPVLVLGGTDDKIVDVQAMKETSEMHSAELELLDGLPHDAMLCTQWEASAKAIASWMMELLSGSGSED